MSDMARRGDRNTVADYEAFIASQPDDTRWELVAVVIVMMTDPTENHGRIAMNLAVPLKAAMDTAGCRTYAGGMRVQSSEERALGDAAIPDIVIRCGPSRKRTFITDSVVVVEVLSRSTMDNDRGPKLAFYKTLPTLHHIAFIYQDQMRVEHYRRGENGLYFQSLTRSSEQLTFDKVDFALDLGAIYFDVPVLRAVEPWSRSRMNRRPR